MLQVEVRKTWPQARGCWCLQTLEEGRRWISLEPPSGTSPSSACKTDSFWTSDFWNRRIINVCCSGLLQLCREPMSPQLWHRVGCVTWCPPSRGGRPGPFPPPAGDLLCSRASRPCGDGLSVRSTCGFLPPGRAGHTPGEAFWWATAICSGSGLPTLKKKRKEKKRLGSGVPGPGNARVRGQPEGPWGCKGAPRPGSTPETQEHLALGLCVASVSRFPGLEGVGLGCQPVPTPLSPPVLARGVGDSGCQMGLGSLPTLLWATCQTDARSSDSPTGSFPTWHQKAPGVTWALCWPCPGRALAQGSGLGGC